MSIAATGGISAGGASRMGKMTTGIKAVKKNTKNKNLLNLNDSNHSTPRELHKKGNHIHIFKLYM